MKTLNEIKVLVVEDDANWKEALCQMYKEIIPRCHVNSASSGLDALRMIENGEKFDLLSLDINLGITHPKTEVGRPDLNVHGADGRSVLRRAHELNACKGVIVITGLAYDTTLALVIPNKKDLMRVKSTLDEYLEDLFQGRKLYLQKIAGCTAVECVSQYKEVLKREKIIRLCKVLPCVPPPYTVHYYSGNEDAPSISIRSRSNRAAFMSISDKGDGKFLYWLGKIKDTAPFFVTKKSVCAIYRGEPSKNLNKSELSQYAETDINSLRRRLRKGGIDPCALFDCVRGLGWKIKPDVTLRGFASVNVRGRGFGGKFGGHDMIDDLPDDTDFNSSNHRVEDSDS